MAGLQNLDQTIASFSNSNSKHRRLRRSKGDNLLKKKFCQWVVLFCPEKLQ